MKKPHRRVETHAEQRARPTRGREKNHEGRDRTHGGWRQTQARDGAGKSLRHTIASGAKRALRELTFSIACIYTFIFIFYKALVYTLFFFFFDKSLYIHLKTQPKLNLIILYFSEQYIYTYRIISTRFICINSTILLINNHTYIKLLSTINIYRYIYIYISYYSRIIMHHIDGGLRMSGFFYMRCLCYSIFGNIYTLISNSIHCYQRLCALMYK